MTVTSAESMLLGNAAEALDPLTSATRHVIDFIRWRFSKLPAGGYHWSEDCLEKTNQEGSEVYIAHETPIDVVNVGQRPAITGVIEGISLQGVGIGDRAFVDWTTGATTRMDLIPTTLTIAVLSAVGIEARRLAWFVAEEIWMFRDEITKSHPAILKIGAQPSITKPLPPGSLVMPTTREEWTACIIQSPLYLQHCATTLPMNRRVLQDFTTTITAKTST